MRGSFQEKHQGGITSASVSIQRKITNEEQYALMLEKFNEAKRDRFQNAVDIGKSTLSLTFAREPTLAAIKESLKTCSTDEPVELFRCSSGKRWYEPHEVAEWKFGVVRYEPV